MTGVLHTARINTIEVIVSSDKEFNILQVLILFPCIERPFSSLVKGLCADNLLPHTVRLHTHQSVFPTGVSLMLSAIG